jgi:hypothetical protein
VLEFDQFFTNLGYNCIYSLQNLTGPFFDRLRSVLFSIPVSADEMILSVGVPIPRRRIDGGVEASGLISLAIISDGLIAAAGQIG